MNRREFLQSTAGVAVAAGVVRGLPVEAQGAATHAAEAWPENGTLIPDEGWRLWVDQKAEWKQDVIFLPGDVTQGADGVVMGGGKPLPVDAPTGGWGVLAGRPEGSIEVDLPGTVEQHFWGKFGAGEDGKPRSYTPEEYRYAADDPVPVNGAYFGVSWWWREIEIPAAMQGKRIFLHVRGAHLRAEVYLNEKLVGYSIMEELPFEAELTHAAKPGGKNVLAIRITNPWGRFDWVDGLNEQWGAVKLYRSHGFGGLDRGMTFSAHGGPRIKDVWVFNTSNAQTVQANVLVERTYHMSVCDGATALLEIVDPASGKVVTQKSIEIAGGQSQANCNLQVGKTREFMMTDRLQRWVKNFTCEGVSVLGFASPEAVQPASDLKNSKCSLRHRERSRLGFGRLRRRGWVRMRCFG